MEMEELYLRPPSRQDTLESQRQRQPLSSTLKRLLGKYSANSQLSSPVDDAIEAAARYYSRDAQRFLNDFGHMSRRPKARLHEIFDIFIRLPHRSNETILGEERFEPSKDLSMYDWLNFLRLRLIDVDADSFLLCCFTAENPKPNVAVMYNVLKPFLSQIERRLGVPRRALMYLLSTTHGYSEETVRTITHATRPLDFAVRLELPSTSPNDLPDRDEHATEHAWMINWQYTVARYKGDLDTYIWQPYASPPPFCHAYIFVSTTNVPCVPRALILFSTTRSLHSFRHQHGSTSALFSHLQPSAIGLLHAVYAVYSVALTETKDFLQDVSRQVFDMTFQSRVRPSKEKFQHLLFLNDCRKRTDLDMASNLRLIDDCAKALIEIVPIGENSEEAKILEKIMSKLRGDIEYIKGRLEVVGNSIEKLQTEVESQNNLQSRNTTMVTILAAIYVPLAFVTSFLGMNITEGSARDWLSVTSYNINNNSNSSSNSGTTNSNNSITANDSNLGSPSPQIWDLRWFALLSGPLLFGTIILPLITGPAIRYLCQSYVALRVYWRLGFALLAIAYLILFYGLAYSTRDDNQLAAASLSIICDSTLTVFVLYQLFNAWRFKRRRRVWCSCGFMVMLVWLLDFNVIPSGDVPISFGVLGWIGMLLVLVFLYRREGLVKRRADTRAS